MITEGSERTERLKDDPKAEALFESLSKAEGREEKLEAGLRLAEYLTSTSKNEQARQTLEIIRDYVKTEGERAAFLRREAELLYRQSRYEEAARVLEQAIVALGTQPDPLELFQIYRQQAMVYFRQGFLERAQSFAVGAQAILETSTEKPTGLGKPEMDGTSEKEIERNWASLYHVLALIDGASGNQEGAVWHYDREIDILERLDEEDRLGSVYNNISGLLKTKGNLARALEYQLKSYQLASQGRDQLSRAISCNNLAELHYCIGDLGQAEDYYTKYLELNKKIDNHLGDAFGLAGLGRIAQARGELDKAEQHLKAALDVARGVKSRSKEASILAELCGLHCEQERLQEASAVLDQAIAICLDIQSFNTQRHQLLSSRIKLGQARQAAGAEREKLLAQAGVFVVQALAQPMAIEDEEPLSEKDLEREAYHLQALIARMEGDPEKAGEAAARAWAVVSETLEMLPALHRARYLEKPEIRELKKLRDEL